jgi:hypothetical protein
MSYIGNQPSNTSFLSDTFSGNGTTTVFTMAVAPANTAAVIVAIWGVLQDPTTYGVVGRILTFSQAPPAGTGNISVRYLALPASNITTTAYRSVTEFTATAGQTTFTPASYTPGFINVFRSGVRLGASNYTATNGVTVTLNNAAAAGDLISIESFFVSSVLNAIPAVSGQITPTLLDSTSQSGSGAMILPTGTTAQRPVAPVAGMTRMNTTTGNPEWWDTASAQWIPYSDARPYTVDYLVVAGGGGGGGGEATNGFGGGGAGGGAGGYISATANITPGQLYSIIIGGGGAGGTSVGNVPSPASTSGSPGSGSSLSGAVISATAIAGGFGAQDENTLGGSGGSGGGTGGDSVGAGGSGTTGQGNAGAANQGSRSGGGGGGAGAIATSRNGGNGSTWLNGTTYAGGGGGGAGGASTSTAPGGTGGGGTGAATTGNSAANAGDGGNTPGGANTGGGGGGDAASRNAGGKAGGSGIVIIRYAGSQRALGGTVSSAGGFTFHTFTSSGTYTA